jgi:hypothetical protein
MIQAFSARKTRPTTTRIGRPANAPTVMARIASSADCTTKTRRRPGQLRRQTRSSAAARAKKARRLVAAVT